MEIRMTKELDDRLMFASESFGFDKREVVERAVLFYLDAMDKQLKLKTEFEAWDNLSDEALIKFEEQL
jgi:hypothetical protein